MQVLKKAETELIVLPKEKSEGPQRFGKEGLELEESQKRQESCGCVARRNL